MHVFIDDSSTFQTNGFMCLAGLIASDASWETFNNRWVSLLERHNLAVMHTSEFLSGKGEYRDLGLDFEERISILAEFLDIIREETHHGLFCAITAYEFRTIVNNSRKRIKPEEFLFRRILKRTFDYMSEIKSVETIGIWLDDSDITSSSFLSIWARTKANWKFARSMLGSIAFGDDKALPPLQGADVLANILVRSHASGLDPWHGQSPYSRLFIDPTTRAVATHIKGEIWEAADIDRLREAIVNMAKAV